MQKTPLSMPLPQEREATLFAIAVEKHADKRSVFLDAVCDGDTALRERLEGLLAAQLKKLCSDPGMNGLWSGMLMECAHSANELGQVRRTTGWRKTERRNPASPTPKC